MHTRQVLLLFHVAWTYSVCSFCPAISSVIKQKRLLSTRSEADQAKDEDLDHNNEEEDRRKSWIPEFLQLKVERTEEAIVNGKSGDDLSFFREYTLRGLKAFKEGNLNGSLEYFDKAKEMNTGSRPQPLMQRGILLYIAGLFIEAEAQLRQDINIIEDARLSKATDLRIWRSASLHKLGKQEAAVEALDVGISLLIYMCNFHVLNNLLLIYMCKLHWNLGGKLTAVLYFFPPTQVMRKHPLK